MLLPNGQLGIRSHRVSECIFKSNQSSCRRWQLRSIVSTLPHKLQIWCRRHPSHDRHLALVLCDFFFCGIQLSLGMKLGLRLLCMGDGASNATNMAISSSPSSPTAASRPSRPSIGRCSKPTEEEALPPSLALKTKSSSKSIAPLRSTMCRLYLRERNRLSQNGYG